MQSHQQRISSSNLWFPEPLGPWWLVTSDSYGGIFRWMGGVTWARSEGVSVQPYSSIHVHSGWVSRHRLWYPYLGTEVFCCLLWKESQREQSNTLIFILLFSSLSVFVKIVSFTRKNNAICHWTPLICCFKSEFLSSFQFWTGSSGSCADSVVDALLGTHLIWNQRIQDGILLVN